ncbi:GIY-YIG nuclease family protein [Neobacillus pocheonensis]|uniref:GIY-YIG nuclease family protein n=1 Tax=Neobacillus pocheonensis TaxID=363869 RepID=A0ABT0WFX4_9BACI|nr:GIY-YIG nuclease family protein [Neobacillus pocheonensis]
MSNPGYIYILINPSIEGMVKIGKTTRDPGDRVAELSSATGVPTPFILVYKEYFSNCTLAETIIHGFLEEKGNRVSSNREFFNIAVWEAIKIIQDVTKKINLIENTFEDIESYEQNQQNDLQGLADELLRKGESAYFGHDENLVDYDEAMVLFKKAAKLGSIQAYRYLGDMYHYGNGCKENLNTAINYYKQGAVLGNNGCNAQLGYIFWFLEKHLDNGKKCWRGFFQNLDPRFTDSWEENMIVEYIHLAIQNGLEIEHKNKIMHLKKKLIKNAEQKKTNWLSNKSGYTAVKIANEYKEVLFF